MGQEGELLGSWAKRRVGRRKKGGIEERWAAVRKKGRVLAQEKRRGFLNMTKGFLDGTKRNSRGSLKRGFEK